MRRIQYSEEQIIAIVKEAGTGKPIRELCRPHRISDATFYTWGRSRAGWTYRKLPDLPDILGRYRQQPAA
jgi:putative transposase